MLAVGISAEHHDDHDISSSGEVSIPSVLDDTIGNSLDYMICPQTSTPVKLMDNISLSSDVSQSLSESVILSSSHDSSTVTLHDLSSFSSILPEENTEQHSPLPSLRIDLQSSSLQPANLVDDSPCTTQILHVSHCVSPGFKLVIDNIDKNVKPRYMRLDSQTQSLHYVQIYGVRNRIDLSKLLLLPRTGEICVYDVLPTTEDYRKMKETMAILVARIMTDNLPYFTHDFKSLVQRHIPHLYSHEMSTKSEVVSQSCIYIILVIIM